MTSLTELRFFTTPSHECSYLDDKQAITLFVDPLALVDKNLYSELSSVGFRRSGSHIYRPYCQSCSACIPVRVPVSRFALKRRHRRVLKSNSDLTVTRMPPAMNDEYFALYDRYITQRHSDGDMYPASKEQFESFLVEGRPEASFYEFRESGQLVSVAVADELNDGLSAIYTFFEPEMQSRALGVHAILCLIEETKQLGLAHLYLGYWIKECQKMNYKMEYKPIELYVNNGWVTIEN